MQSVRDGAGFGSSVPDEVGIGEHRFGRKRHGELLAVAVEDGPSRRRQRNVANPLIARQGLERAGVLHLEQGQANEDRREAHHQRDEHRHEPLRRRPSGGVSPAFGGVSWPSGGVSRRHQG